MSNDDFMKTTDEENLLGGAAGGDGDDIVLDLSGDDLKTTKFPLIPIGTWVKFSIYEAEVKPSKSQKNEGKPVYHITLKVLPQEEAKWGSGRRVTIYAPLWSGAFFTAFKVFKALGFDIPKPPKEGERINFRVPGPNKLYGKTLEAKVTKHEQGNTTDDEGNPRLFERFDAFRAVTEGGPNDSDGLDEFASGDGGLFS